MNRLAREKSPYLLQHADNPVDWFAWGEEAFTKARRENKPIFLSIGYSTCHWCHVMAHESFENDTTAQIMNREFVNIKVDREERPDVDRVYMTFVQATTGGGGWPMSVWLTPDLKPFVGGTYFPPEDRHGQPAFGKVLERIAAAWKENREKISGQGERILQALREATTSGQSIGKFDLGALDVAYEEFARTFDAREGGFGGAPKFPRPVTLNFLTRFYARHRRSDSGQRALEMALFTLRKMAAGGIHDHIGGGFHRYAVDAVWHVPHFEKMLYDQAQLANVYLDAFQITREPLFEVTARDTLDYVGRDMTSAEGGFYSAEDADSPISVAAVSDRRNELPPEAGAQRAPPQKGEGAFYVWTKREIDSALGETAQIFDFHYGVLPDGNALAASDPHGEFTGKNILFERHSVAETAAHFRKTEEETGMLLAHARAELFAIRAKRPRPHLDDKIIAAWNGLMISAFARAAQVLDDAKYLETAERAAEFVRTQLYDESRKVLARNFRQGRSVDGFADDYAFVIQGMLDLYEASFQAKWLSFAFELQATLDAEFFDEETGGYFTVTGRDPSILLRMKEDNDSAEPAASSIATLNLARMAAIRNDSELLARANKTMAAFTRQLATFPTALPQMLVALDFLSAAPRQIVLAGVKADEHGQPLLREIRRHFLPRTVLLLADGGASQKFLGENRALLQMAPIGGKATVYVCQNFTCHTPITDPDELAELLRKETIP
ncbi:MAG: hypothetical protein QOH24_1298 [Verrucomicrobiota bacterium]